LNIKFDKRGLVPVVAQDVETKEVLMLAYANQEALDKSVETKEAHYYSRSRKELWHKGATSGHIQHIADIRYDCDSDAVLYLVHQDGAACHTGEYTCFYRSIDTLVSLQQVTERRKENPKEGSYTNYLFEKGLDKILKKIGEESAETIIAAKNNDKNETARETADLLYHLTVLLTAMGLKWQNVITELKNRER
jgi:phosphoribosyl-ATP pyrophosphohydrolase/phosphoribosyl-AMP cyclohydrolase